MQTTPASVNSSSSEIITRAEQLLATQQLGNGMEQHMSPPLTRRSSGASLHDVQNHDDEAVGVTGLGQPKVTTQHEHVRNDDINNGHTVDTTQWGMMVTQIQELKLQVELMSRREEKMMATFQKTVTETLEKIAADKKTDDALVEQHVASGITSSGAQDDNGLSSSPVAARTGSNVQATRKGHLNEDSAAATPRPDTSQESDGAKAAEDPVIGCFIDKVSRAIHATRYELPKLTPERDVAEWVDAMDHYVRGESLAGERLKTAIRTALEMKKHRDWWSVHASDIESWDQFKTEFLQDCKERTSDYQWLRKINETRQKSGQLVTEYVTEVLAMYKKMKQQPPWCDQLLQIIEGVEQQYQPILLSWPRTTKKVFLTTVRDLPLLHAHGKRAQHEETTVTKNEDTATGRRRIKRLVEEGTSEEKMQLQQLLLLV